MINIPFLERLFGSLKPENYDDSIDRLNYYYTTLMLMFFSIVVSAKQYVGSPIQCWIPAEFKGGWEQYTEDYCFIKNTYFLPLHETIPNDYQRREEKEIGYYQWVPIVLALQALLFFVPNMIWKSFCSRSGNFLSSAFAFESRINHFVRSRLEISRQLITRMVHMHTPYGVSPRRNVYAYTPTSDHTYYDHN